MLVTDDDYPRAYGYGSIWYIVPYKGATPVDVFEDAGDQFAHWVSGLHKSEEQLVLFAAKRKTLRPEQLAALRKKPFMKGHNASN